jgi:hypothetical protein
MSLAEATTLCFSKTTKPAKKFSIVSIKHVAWRVKKGKATLPINMPYLAYIRYSLSECDQETLILLNKSVMTHHNRLCFDQIGDCMKKALENRIFAYGR